MAESYHDSSLRLSILLPKQQKEVSEKKAVAAGRQATIPVMLRVELQ